MNLLHKNLKTETEEKMNELKDIAKEFIKLQQKEKRELQI